MVILSSNSHQQTCIDSIFTSVPFNIKLASTCKNVSPSPHKSQILLVRQRHGRLTIMHLQPVRMNRSVLCPFNMRICSWCVKPSSECSTQPTCLFRECFSFYKEIKRNESCFYVAQLPKNLPASYFPTIFPPFSHPFPSIFQPRIRTNIHQSGNHTPQISVGKVTQV